MANHQGAWSSIHGLNLECLGLERIDFDKFGRGMVSEAAIEYKETVGDMEKK